jgi:hypothetical protein
MSTRRRNSAPANGENTMQKRHKKRRARYNRVRRDINIRRATKTKEQKRAELAAARATEAAK